MPPKSQKAPTTTKTDPPSDAPNEDQQGDTTQKAQGEQYTEAQADSGQVRGSLPGEAAAAEDSTKTEGDGPKIVPGPTGTVPDPNDPSIGTVDVYVNSNVTLGNELYTVDSEKVQSVPNTAETRAAINAGHLTLKEDRENDGGDGDE